MPDRYASGAKLRRSGRLGWTVLPRGGTVPGMKPVLFLCFVLTLGACLAPDPASIEMAPRTQPQTQGEIAFVSRVFNDIQPQSIAEEREFCGLIGVDASYAVPDDAKISGNHRVKEIDMESDDPNHFHPDYFGKGKRWHEPNVDVMLKAYDEAERETRKKGVSIINATKGGKLEVFPRVNYDTLFKTSASRPKVLLFDMTRVGEATATGQLKQTLLADWSQSSICQVFHITPDRLGISLGGNFQEWSVREERDEIRSLLAQYDPDVVLFRPTPESPGLHSIAMEFIRDGGAMEAALELGAWAKPGEGRQAVFERPLEPTIARLSESVPEEYMEEVQIFGLNTGELMIFFHGHTENEQGAIEDIGVRYLLDHETHEVIKREEGFRSEMDDLPRSALMDFIVTLHIKLHAPNP